MNNKLIDKNSLSFSGIYKFLCSDCDIVYLGQTGRQFKVRFKEDIKSCNDKNIFSNVLKICLAANTIFRVCNRKVS